MKSSREVINDLYRSSSPERIGLRDSPWSDTLRKWVSQGYPEDAEGNPVAPSEHFDFDMFGVGGFEWIAKLQEEVIVDQTDEWKVVRDGNGAYFKWWKDKSGTPEHVDFSMTSRKIWEEEYKPHVVGSVEKRVTSEALAKMRGDLERARSRDKWASFGFRGLWENMRGAFGDIALYENMLLDPEWIRDYCRTYTDLYIEEFNRIVEEQDRPDDIWFYDDLGYRGATFCSPKLFGELIFPFYAELIEHIHKNDIPVTLHSCGYTEPVLDLVVEVGFDGINPLEVKAGNEILHIADKYSDRLVFIGGLDARVMESHDRDYIRSEVKKIMEGLKERGGRFVFGSDHSLSTNIDYQDFQYALDVYREYMGY